MMNMPNIPYQGRFAPSPSGSLHFGSLVAALGSYLQAKSQQGTWQVRIDDLDPPREVQGAAEDILHTLQAYGLHWDGDVVYQSQRYPAYEKIISQLNQQHICYACACTRKSIKENGGIYQGLCRNRHLPMTNHALRLNMSCLNDPITYFYDQLQGDVYVDLQEALEDFIVKRKDGLYGYNLAVVIDDINQGITEIVRGADLLPTTSKQIALYRLLNIEPPNYVHLPLAVTSPGHKLSKQNHALAIDKNNPIPTLLKALKFLGYSVTKELDKLTCSEILQWAIKNWSLAIVPKKQEILVDF